MVYFINNFWQGKQPLAKSFWLFYSLLFVITSYLSGFIYLYIATYYQFNVEDLFLILLDKNVFLFIFVSLYAILDLAIYIWALVGTWRSASNYKKIKKNKIPWGTLTKITIVLHITVYELWELWIYIF